jgi:Tfp pilus assembly protein PilN
MIKVNLLKDPTARMHKAFVKPTVSRAGLAFVAIIVLVAGGMGAWYYILNTQAKNLTEKRNKLRIEEARLTELKKELTKFEEISRQRQNRIDVIEKLKQQQTGPVLLLNHVLHSIPRNRLLWLTSLTQKDNNVKVVGYAQQIEAIPDFMTNLAETGFFISVDLEGIESQKDASRFSLLCMSAQYQPEE